MKAKQKPAGMDLPVGAQTQCLTGAAKSIEQYFNGELPGDGIRSLATCLDGALDQFAKFVRGEEAGVYKSEELANFMSQYFLSGFEIPTSLQVEAMELKKVILGGDSKYLTQEELQRTRELIKALAAELVRLQPFMPLTPTQYDLWSVEKRALATTTLRDCAKRLGEIFQKTAGEYTFEHVEGLLYEIERLFPPEARVGGIRWVRENLNLFRAAKVLANGTPSHIILAHEWVRLFQVAMHWYSVYLEFRNFFSAFDGHFSNDRTLKSLESLTSETIELLQDILRQRPNQVFLFQEIDWFLDFVFPKGTLDIYSEKNGVRKLLYAIRVKESIKPFVRVVVQRLLGGIDLGARGRGAAGITVSGLQVLKAEAMRWVYTQRLLNQVFEAAEREGGYSPMGYTPENLFALADDLWRNPVAGGEEVKADAKALIRDFRPLFLADDSSVTFTVSLADRRVSLTNVSTFNWLRGISRLLFRGYSEDPERIVGLTGLKKHELEHFTDDFRPLGLDLKIFDPRFADAGIKRFTEANLFTFHSKGAEMINRDSFAELVGYLLSSKRLADKIHLSIAEACKAENQTLPLDAVGFQKIDPKCYREVLYLCRRGPCYKQFWTRLPGMIYYYEHLSLAEQAAFQRTYEMSVRRFTDGYEENRVFEIDDSEGMATVLHYTEAIFQRFDKNSSGTIDQDEALEAYPVFRGVIQSASRSLGQEVTDPMLLRGLFLYLLSTGEKPNLDSITIAGKSIPGPGTLKFLWWVWTSEGRKFDTDRQTILKIFALIGQSLK